MIKHPLHPALVHMPIGLWSLASILDGLAFVGVSSHFFSKSTGYLIGAGLVFSVPAIIAGIFDFTRAIRINKHSNLKMVEVDEIVAKTALIERIIVHAVVMAGATSLYTMALLLRIDSGVLGPPTLWASLCSGLGFVVLAIGGWFGGDLVYVHGVNVAPANIN